MLKQCKKLVAVFVSITMLLTSISMDAVAETISLEPEVFEETNTPIAAESDDADVTIMGELVEKREANIKHYRMSDGSITAAVYPQEVHYQDENGQFVDINNSLADDTDGTDKVLATQENEFQVKFMKKSNKNKLYTLNKGKEKITVSIEGVSKVKAKQQETSEFSTDKATDYQLSNIGSAVIYENIFDNVDLEYTVVSKEFKENIILKEAVDFDCIIYNYQFGNHLEPVQIDTQTVFIQEKDGSNVVATISAPLMWDSAGHYYDDLKLTIKETKNGKASIELKWDKAAIQNAVYPVTVDPVMSFSVNRLEIQDTHILAAYPTTNYNATNHIRVRNNGYALLQFPTPILNSGDKIIHAELVLYPYGNFDSSLDIYTNENSYNPPLYINVHKILRSWDETTATYQNVNPDNGFYDSTVYAYRVVDGDDSYYTWNITRLANEWTEGHASNYGILLKYDQPPADGSVFDSFFCSTNGKYIDSSAWPQILYQYINTTGVEDYFSYHSQDLGYAGTGYVNDLTGNLTIINPILQTGGSVMPITVSLVYNTNNIDEESTPYGRGWSINWSQKIDRTIETDFGYCIAKYVDGDGTEHYFDYDSKTGLFIDEINPKRIIVYIDADNYVIDDGSGMHFYFKRHPNQRVWYLWKMADTYGNYIQATLNASDYNKIEKLTSSTGNEINFTYNSYNFLTGVTYDDSGVNKTITIAYNTYVSQANNCIGKVTFPDNTFVQYHYYYAYANQPYCISKAVDVDGTSIAYAYNTQGPLRVSCIHEYSSADETGDRMTATYDASGTLFTDTVNNRKYLYTFAANGTLKSVVDVTTNEGNGYGQYYEYNNGNSSTPKGTGNLTFVSKVQKSTVNLLRNHSFENDSVVPTLQAWFETTATSTGIMTTERSHIGSRSYKLTRPAGSNSTRTLGFYGANVVSGKTYTVSAYVNTTEMTSMGKGVSLYVGANGIQYESEYITEAKDEWQRISLTFTAPYTERVSICMTIIDATGSVYFDNIQVEEGGLSDYNLLENAGFEQDNITGDNGWRSYTEALDYTTTQSFSGSRSGRRIGGIQAWQEYQQLVNVPNGKAGDTYVASAFAKAASVPASNWQFSLLVRFSKNGVDVNEQNILFNSNTTEWQKIAGVAKATGDYDTIQFWLLYYTNHNTVYFDNAQLIMDTFGNTYTYDNKGNLISTTDLQNKEEYTFQYDGNNQLIKETNVSGGSIEYTYNTTNKKQLDAVSSGGVKTEYTYDSRGNVTSTSMKSSEGESSVITSSATYSDDGEYMKTITDSRGNTTQYEYNESRGLVDYATFPDGSVTDYTYNGSELLTNVSVKKDNNTSTATYNYNSVKQLSSITSPSGTVYGFTYDTFGRNSAIKIGTERYLSNFVYNSKMLLEQMAYGNGTTVQYIYDNLNRQVGTSINDVLRYQYTYDGSSRLLEVFDVLNNKKIKYDYDILDRIAIERIIDTVTKAKLAEFEIQYDDTKNRVSGYDVSIGNTEKSTDFIYGELTKAPDIITGIKQNGTRILSYGYDVLNRLQTRTIATTTPFVTQYGYLEGNGTNKTTTLVKTVKNGNDTLQYSYDNMGNITSVSKNGIIVESYTYDYLGQLQTVTRGSDAYEYTYDNGGNILSVKQNGETIKTYTYGDSEWKDLLTTYNGETITYDTIGNPLTYRAGMNFTWTDGRKLTGITKGTDSISYTYDANGLRGSKTVNGTTTEYYWLNGMLQGQKTGNEYILFLHDESGSVYGFSLKNGTEESYYYYEFNLQGDIIGIIDSNGNKVVEYTYNEWGQLLSTTGTLADTIGQKNPLRYRGYYYDAETGFYYVSSRYYDPEIGRFISADSAISGTGESVHGYNLYSYCFNNPVNMSDPTGNWPKWVKTIASRVINAVKTTVKIITSPFKAVKASVGGGIGIGGKVEANVNNIPIEVGAVVSNSDSVILENNRVDTQNSTSVDVSLNILNVVDYSYTKGHKHSYYANDCNCNFMNSTFGEKSSCIANKPFMSNDTTICFSLSAYLLIGFDISVGIDMAVWSEELISIFNESLSYSD